ncbi:zinc finger CW-type PWWP domain protein 1 isoform X4 [Microcebus murinus]|uniref:zinc finger CW-type PWWP domain protein 1 isoform X4 n=1 Tax=Microcebus murinus TaxID=30608 RepID=UPI003F6C3581
MMTTLQNKEECGKRPKKIFAPPVQKLHSLILCSTNSPKEETLGISSPETETRPHLPKARLEKKEEKATTENGPSSGQKKKGKAQDNKQVEKKAKEKSSISNEEFEEIVQIVLRKSLQECLGQCLIWVQCSSPNCEKWRRLRGNIDPAVLPDNWSCDQNTDLEYNSCDIPEETWTGHESDIAYASYIPGSIIWAKQYGYPWWPGMVESDPDLGEYFLFASHLDSLPSKYHVTFFGETVSRAWIPVNMLKNFQELSLELAGVKKCRNKDCSQKLGAALIMAQEAEQISIQERVNLFGFRSRYNGSDSSGEGKDLMLSGTNSPDSCLEKEEEEEESEVEEEEEEEKKDPTLSGPKSIKTQTKKPKPRGSGGDAGMANGQGGTLKRKTVKRSLGSESTAPPASITGKKEGHGNSDSDKLGPKKKFKTPEIKASATSLSEEIESRMVPQGLSPPARVRACASARKEGPRFQESLTQEVGSVPHEDEASSDLDLELLMEDIGKEREQRGEPQHRDDEEEFTVAFFEE